MGRVREHHAEIRASLGVGEARSRQLEAEALHRLRATTTSWVQAA